MVAYKHSTRVESADHILEDLIVAARASGNDNAIRAARVLETWDRETDADSRGAVLYEAFWRELQRHRWPRGPFDVPWRSDAPLSTPDGLADPAAAANLLDAAAARVARTYGAIDVAWGDVYRLRRDGIDLPASGGPGGMGVFRVIGFEESPDGRGIATSGDSFVAVIEFGPTLRAAALLSYGNASRIGSPHRTDQLPLLARNQLRPVWRTRAEIEANLEKRVVY
jgi:acyl-homoserine-lactone acylase